MSNIKLTELTELTSLTDNDLFYVVDSETGTSKKVKLSTVQKYARPYKSFTFLATQTSTGAPTITELENAIGTTTPSYSGEGVYGLSCTGAFPAGKTYSPQNAIVKDDTTGQHFLLEVYRDTDNDCTIKTSSIDGGVVPANGLLNGTFIEIRVYD